MVIYRDHFLLYLAMTCINTYILVIFYNSWLFYYQCLLGLFLGAYLVIEYLFVLNLGAYSSRIGRCLLGKVPIRPAPAPKCAPLAPNMPPPLPGENLADVSAPSPSFENRKYASGISYVHMYVRANKAAIGLFSQHLCWGSSDICCRVEEPLSNRFIMPYRYLNNKASQLFTSSIILENKQSKLQSTDDANNYGALLFK